MYPKHDSPERALILALIEEHQEKDPPRFLE